MLWWETWAWQCDGRECLVEAAPQQYKHTQTKIQKRECLVAPKNTNKHKQKYKKWFTIDALDVSFAIFKCGRGGPQQYKHTQTKIQYDSTTKASTTSSYTIVVLSTPCLFELISLEQHPPLTQASTISLEQGCSTLSLTHSLVIPRKASTISFDYIIYIIYSLKLKA